MPLISIDDMSLTYPLRDTRRKAVRTVFSRVSAKFNIQPGYILGIMGESGSGKSTLLRLIAGNQKSTGGQVSVGDVSTEDLIYLPQGGISLDHLSLNANLRLFESIKATKGRFSAERLEKAIRILELDGLLDEEAEVARLSGGEKQRMSLARMFSLAPRLILLDEPCAGIGGDHRQEFLVLLKNACSELNTAAIIASHDFQDHACIADTVIFLCPPEHQRAQLTEMPVTKFRHEPPWREAVAYAWNVPVNWVRADLRPQGWFASIGEEELGPVTLEPAPDDPLVYMACPPSSLAASGTTAAESSWERFGSSNLYSFYRKGQAILIAERGAEASRSPIQIRGRIHFYSEAGAFINEAEVRRIDGGPA